jgi:hypothetical protein
MCSRRCHKMCEKYDKIKIIISYIFCNEISGLIASYCTTRKESKGIIDLNHQYSKVDEMKVYQCCCMCNVRKTFVKSKHPAKYVVVKSFK